MPLDIHQAVFVGIALGVAIGLAKNTIWEVPSLLAAGATFFWLLSNLRQFILEVFLKSLHG